MANHSNHIASKKPIGHLVLDMSDCYTWSFPEFTPFCPQLYYFSSFKAFKNLAQAWYNFFGGLGLLALDHFNHSLNFLLAPEEANWF